MSIDNLTIGEAKQLATMFNGNAGGHPYEVGGNYFIRTVTHYFTGRLVAVFEQELVLEDVAWIASTGRYSDAMKTGEYDEVEPYPDGEVVIGRGSIIDARLNNLILPRVQK